MFWNRKTEPEVRAYVKEVLHEELSHFLDDIEFRLKQTRDTIQGSRMVYAEDLNLFAHQITGYTITANSPGAGQVAWASLHVVYNGTDYTITNGSSANRYIWFDAAVSTTLLQSSNTKPTLSGNACLLWINNAGTPIQALNNTMPPVVANGAVDSGALANGAVLSAAIADGAVTGAKTDFYTSLAGAVTAAQNAADLAQATADGSITTYFQADAPWANGTTQPVSKVGDIWYDSDDGQAYRWSGASGSPANTWVAISDSDIGAALSAANNAQAKADIKTTTYYSVAATAPTAPTPPVGNGFTTGDFWVVTDQGNLVRRWSGSAWVDLAVGTGAIGANAVTGAKIANNTITTTQISTTAGIVGTQLANNTLTTTQISNSAGITGTQIAGTTIGTGNLANGAVTNPKIGSGAIAPVNLNVLQHVIF